MRIQHNIMAMNSFRSLGINNNNLSKSLEKLSSGYKINRAGDDAAGLAISEKMRAQITGLEASINNVKDGISLVKTAEGSLQEIHDMLNRMVYLSEQSANGTYEDAVDRNNLQLELNSLRDEVDRIAESANFNGIKLLNGDLASSGAPKVEGLELATSNATKAKYESGAVTSADNITADKIRGIEIKYTDEEGKLQTAEVQITNDGTNTYVNGKAVTIGDAAATAAAYADALKNDANFSKVFDVSAGSGKLTFTAKTEGATKASITKITEDKTDDAKFTPNTDLTVTETKGQDAFEYTDFANDYNLEDVFTVNGEKFAFVKDDNALGALDKDITGVVVGNGANVAAGDVTKMAAMIEQKTGYKPALTSPTADTKLLFVAAEAKDYGGLELQIGDTSDTYNRLNVAVDAMDSKAIGISDVDISTQGAAQDAIDKIKNAINSVSTTRGNLGAIQNRLEHTQNNLAVTRENIQDAESTVRDVDVAEEMMEFTKNNILIQSAQAMLAQANQVPQGVLSLLQ